MMFLTRFFPIAFMTFSIGMFSGIQPATAQNEARVLSLVIPAAQESRFTPELINAFETQYSDVTLNIVADRPPLLESEVTNPQAYLDGLFDYVIKGDVLFVFDLMLSPAATQTGYFLNLMPLMNADSDLNAESYYTGLWQSYQWDGGAWALPYAAAPILLAYDSAKFDQAGITYPDDTWTLTQYADAARLLTQYDERGDVVAPGLLLPSGIPQNALLRLLLGQKFYDDTMQPHVPRLNTPEIEAFTEVWTRLESEGVIASSADQGYTTAMQVVNLAVPFEPLPTTRWSLLASGVVAVQSQAFAINAGTNHPELAYELALFLSKRPELVGMGRVSAVRENMHTIEVSQQQESILQRGLENILPYHELLYTPYFVQAMAEINNTGTSIADALAAFELQATDTRVFAAEYGTANSPYVAVLGAPAGLRPGEIALNFGLSTLFPPQQLPSQPQWDQAINEFVAIDSEVGSIIITNVQSESLDEMAQSYDCFTTLFNLIDVTNTRHLINLEPLLNADPAFDTDDLLGDSLQRLTFDNRIWGIPLSYQVGVMVYDMEQFNAANLSHPRIDWTLNDFRTTLDSLQLNADSPPFWPSGGGRNYVLPLIAAYGGLPIDYRTNPPTINFTSDETINAIRQALSLVETGHMYYVPLISRRVTSMSEWYGPPINDGVLEFVRFFPDEGRYGFTTYPANSAYRVLPLSITAGYISAWTTYPEACYRWLSFIRTRPELAQGMPVYQSLLDSPNLSAVHGATMTEFYQALAPLLQAPSTLQFPLFEEGIITGTALTHYWLYDAIDQHVLANRPLEEVLPQAQTHTEDFLACVRGLPIVETSFERLTQIVTCVRQVDLQYTGF